MIKEHRTVRSVQQCWAHGRQSINSRYDVYWIICPDGKVIESAYQVKASFSIPFPLRALKNITSGLRCMLQGLAAQRTWDSPVMDNNMYGGRWIRPRP